MENKKIFTIIGIGLLIILLIVACFTGNDNSKETDSDELSNDINTILENAKKESNAVTADEQGELKEINIDTYLDYYKDSENRVVLIARPTCGYCQIAEPIIKKIIKDYDAEIYYLNTDNLSGDDSAKFTQSDAEFKDGFGTPMLLVVGNSKISDKVDGLTDTAHYIKFLKDNKFIK